jgi:hypothetical protein
MLFEKALQDVKDELAAVEFNEDANAEDMPDVSHLFTEQVLQRSWDILPVVGSAVGDITAYSQVETFARMLRGLALREYPDLTCTEASSVDNLALDAYATIVLFPRAPRVDVIRSIIAVVLQAAHVAKIVDATKGVDLKLVEDDTDSDGQ